MAGRLAAASETGSFAHLLRQVAPAVVDVATTGSDEGDEEFGTVQELARQQATDGTSGRSLGSGLIVTADGDILTNRHLVQGVAGIRVRLTTTEEYEARVIGVDERTDIALLHVAAPRALPTLPRADSDELQVGDWVLAIASPLTRGPGAVAAIVAARPRIAGAGPSDAIIETSASLPAGCSGGPLVDADGRVVGISVAPVAPTVGGPSGFAVPISLAHWVSDQLRAYGRVVRGFIGVTTQALTPELARSFGVSQGALVAEVEGDSPAARGGVDRGDVIVRWDHQPVPAPRELLSLVAATPPGTRVLLGLWRSGRARTVEITVREAPADLAPSEQPAIAAGTLPEWGFVARALREDEANRDGLTSATGVVVVGVDDAGPADVAGLEPGDLILQVNRLAVHSLSELKRALASKPDRALVLVRRGTASIYLEPER